MFSYIFRGGYFMYLRVHFYVKISKVDFDDFAMYVYNIIYLSIYTREAPLRGKSQS